MTQFLPPNLLALFAPRDPIPFIPPIEKHAHHRKLPYNGVAQFLGEFEDPCETPAKVRVETREERKKRKVIMVKNINTGKPRGFAFVEFEHERDMHAAVKAMNGKKIDAYRVIADIERGRTRTDWRPRRLGKGIGKSRQGPSDKSRSKNENGSDSDAHKTTINRDHGRRRHSRSRSRSHDRDRRPDRERHRKHKGSDHDHDRELDHKRRKYKRDDTVQYGEYSAEIRAEYNGDN